MKKAKARQSTQASIPAVKQRDYTNAKKALDQGRAARFKKEIEASPGLLRYSSTNLNSLFIDALVQNKEDYALFMLHKGLKPYDKVFANGACHTILHHVVYGDHRKLFDYFLTKTDWFGSHYEPPFSSRVTGYPPQHILAIRGNHDVYYLKAILEAGAPVGELLHDTINIFHLVLGELLLSALTESQVVLRIKVLIEASEKQNVDWKKLITSPHPSFTKMFSNIYSGSYPELQKLLESHNLQKPEKIDLPEKSNLELFQAAQRASSFISKKDHRGLRLTLEQTPELISNRIDGAMPLIVQACKEDNYEAIKILLEKGMSPMSLVAEERGVPPIPVFAFCIRWGDAEALALFLNPENGPNCGNEFVHHIIDTMSGKRTPVQFALECASVKSLKFLLANGAVFGDIEKKSRKNPLDLLMQAIAFQCFDTPEKIEEIDTDFVEALTQCIEKYREEGVGESCLSERTAYGLLPMDFAKYHKLEKACTFLRQYQVEEDIRIDLCAELLNHINKHNTQGAIDCLRGNRVTFSELFSSDKGHALGSSLQIYALREEMYIVYKHLLDFPEISPKYFNDIDRRPIDSAVYIAVHNKNREGLVKMLEPIFIKSGFGGSEKYDFTGSGEDIYTLIKSYRYEVAHILVKYTKALQDKFLDNKRSALLLSIRDQFYTSISSFLDNPHMLELMIALAEPNHADSENQVKEILICHLLAYDKLELSSVVAKLQERGFNLSLQSARDIVEREKAKSRLEEKRYVVEFTSCSETQFVSKLAGYSHSGLCRFLAKADSGGDILQLAIKKGYRKVVSFIIENHPSFIRVGSENLPPFEYALKNKQLVIAAMLLDKKSSNEKELLLARLTNCSEREFKKAYGIIKNDVCDLPLAVAIRDPEKLSEVLQKCEDDEEFLCDALALAATNQDIILFNHLHRLCKEVSQKILNSVKGHKPFYISLVEIQKKAEIKLAEAEKEKEALKAREREAQLKKELAEQENQAREWKQRARAKRREEKAIKKQEARQKQQERQRVDLDTTELPSDVLAIRDEVAGINKGEQPVKRQSNVPIMQESDSKGTQYKKQPIASHDNRSQSPYKDYLSKFENKCDRYFRNGLQISELQRFALFGCIERAEEAPKYMDEILFKTILTGDRNTALSWCIKTNQFASINCSRHTPMMMMAFFGRLAMLSDFLTYLNHENGPFIGHKDIYRPKAYELKFLFTYAAYFGSEQELTASLFEACLSYIQIKEKYILRISEADLLIFVKKLPRFRGMVTEALDVCVVPTEFSCVLGKIMALYRARNYDASDTPAIQALAKECPMP